MIQTTLTGRLGKDATTNSVNGKNVINFSVAVDIGYGDKKSTLWVEAAHWTDKTGLLPYLKKGTQVLVIGEPNIRTWEKGASFTLRVAQIELIGGKSEVQQATAATPAAQHVSDDINSDTGDLPF